jgi:hypothetical protein
MNQPTANPSNINNLSALKEGPALVAPARQPSAELSLSGTQSKPANRKPQPKPKSFVKLAPQDRCRHFTATGRQCRLAILDRASGLCFRHVGRQFLASGDEDLSPAFLGLLSGFQSASRIHDFVTQVTVLLVQNRISTRRAAILAYLAQILLRTLPPSTSKKRLQRTPSQWMRSSPRTCGPSSKPKDNLLTKEIEPLR